MDYRIVDYEEFQPRLLLQQLARFVVPTAFRIAALVFGTLLIIIVGYTWSNRTHPAESPKRQQNTYTDYTPPTAAYATYTAYEGSYYNYNTPLATACTCHYCQPNFASYSIGSVEPGGRNIVLSSTAMTFKTPERELRVTSSAKRQRALLMGGPRTGVLREWLQKDVPLTPRSGVLRKWLQKDVPVTPRPRLHSDYYPTEEDQSRNSRRNYHPRPFDKPDDARKKIRLLKVLPLAGKDPSTPIECYFLDPRHFGSTAFWERIKYTALSYTWGRACLSSDVEDILIFDEPVSVRRNLWDFLHTMRRLQNEGPFWIDALCIDQLQMEEKAQQLELMPKIYAKAEAVIIWLGNCATAAGIDGLRQLQDRCSKPGPTLIPGRTNRWMGLKYLVENKYWTRLWIVQEIFMAKKIHVYTGDLRWDFTELVCLQQKFEAEHKDDINWSNWKSIVETKQDWKKPRKRSDLHDVLYRWSHHECRDAHDKVYGLLGLVSNPKITIDLSIRVIDLFQEVLRVEEKKIFARKYGYASEFAAKLLTSLGLDGDVEARKIKMEFLKGYRE